MRAEQQTLFLIADFDIGAAACEEFAMPDVAVAVLHNRLTDKVLLIRRSRRSDFVGWVFPGGKIEGRRKSHKKEDSVAAARRELAEETGLYISNAGKEIFCRKHPATGVLIRYVYFVCEEPTPGGASNHEPHKADDCVWVELSKVSKMFRGGLSEGIVRGIKRELAACSVPSALQSTFELQSR